MANESLEFKLQQRVLDQGDGFIPFDGQNCFDYGDCAGWDGVSRRCDCGNRRVLWALKHGAKKGSQNPDDYYAEAY